MTFQKAVLKKNKKKAQCVVLESKKAKEKPKLHKEKCKKKDEIMWLDIYKELQRRNLDKIKVR